MLAQARLYNQSYPNLYESTLQDASTSNKINQVLDSSRNEHLIYFNQN